MFKQIQLPRAGPIVLALVFALVLVPSASSGNYGDASGDKAGGQVVFRIAGVNIASSEQNELYLDIDADANPLTGSLSDGGAEYSFAVDNDTYGFGRWDGAQWVRASNATVRVSGDTSLIMISVNRSELGNTADFNFVVTALNLVVNGNVALIGLDVAPDDGAFNYSFEANGPQIDTVDVQTTPSAGPRAGKKFVIAPTALHLPADGRSTPTPLVPESYSCSATLGAKRLAGSGTGGCTISIPKKKARGKKLTVNLTVNYQGATKVVPLTFKVR